MTNKIGWRNVVSAIAQNKPNKTYKRSVQRHMLDLFEILDGAMLVRHDKQRSLILVWFGGTQIHVYNRLPDMVSIFSFCADCDPANIHYMEAEEAMNKAMEIGNYPKV